MTSSSSGLPGEMLLVLWAVQLLPWQTVQLLLMLLLMLLQRQQR
jgi:hypothetical protein